MIQSLVPMLLPLILQGCNSSKEEEIYCACNCLSAIITLTSDQSLQQLSITTLPLLFEKLNEFLFMDTAISKSILDCISSIQKAIIRWIVPKKTSTETIFNEELFIKAISIFIQKQQSSDPRITTMCREAVYGLLSTTIIIPSSMLQSIIDYLKSKRSA